MLWLCSKVNSYVYAYSLPALEFVGGVHVGSHPDWLTFSPDSKFVYVANAGSNSTSVVDTEALRQVVQIPVGQVPKRVITAVVPPVTVDGWTNGASQASGATSSRDALDYEFFREEVEPIFVRKREGHARCVVCHATRTRFRLQAPPPEGATWNAEQSRRNFATARRMVVPGNPLASQLLLLPLAEDAGGNTFPPGRQALGVADRPGLADDRELEPGEPGLGRLSAFGRCLVAGKARGRGLRHPAPPNS